MTFKADDGLQRSPLYRQWPEGSVMPCGDGAVIASTRVHAESGHPVLMDLSCVSRYGLRGLNAAALLSDLGYVVPEKPNLATTSSKGTWLRLSPREFWLLNPPSAPDTSVSLLDRAAKPDHCYPLFCQDSHAWLCMAGDHLPEIMAKVCGVDLRPAAFPLNSIVQSSVARVNAIIAHHHVADEAVFSLLCDSAAAAYMWEALLDAMAEFDGLAAGIDRFL